MTPPYKVNYYVTVGPTETIVVSSVASTVVGNAWKVVSKLTMSSIECVGTSR